MTWATSASNAAAWPPGISVNTMAGAVRGAVVVIWVSRADWISTTQASRATPRPMAGLAVWAAERGPARLARPSLAGPLARRRALPAPQAAARPRAQRIANETATPAIMIAAASGVGA